MNKRLLLIMRSVSGNFKSTIANYIKLGAEADGLKADVLSADEYPGYYVDGSYEWTPERCGKAHGWCYSLFQDLVLVGEASVIILDNTNLSRKDWKRYEEFANLHEFEVKVLDLWPNPDMLEEYAQRNKHSVPLDKIKLQYEKYKNGKL